MFGRDIKVIESPTYEIGWDDEKYNHYLRINGDTYYFNFNMLYTNLYCFVRQDGFELNKPIKKFYIDCLDNKVIDIEQ